MPAHQICPGTEPEGALSGASTLEARLVGIVKIVLEEIRQLGADGTFQSFRQERKKGDCSCSEQRGPSVQGRFFEKRSDSGLLKSRAHGARRKGSID